jgi:ATP synthase protein I
MDERDPLASLRDLGTGLERARQGRIREAGVLRRGKSAETGNALGLAFRISLELVVAIVVAVGIGWAIDRWLGTRPWGMIVFFFLGIGAGLVNVYRAIAGLGKAVDPHGRGAPDTGSLEEDED